MSRTVLDHEQLCLQYRRGPIILGRDHCVWRRGAYLHLGPVVFTIDRESGWSVYISLMGRASLSGRLFGPVSESGT